LHGHPGTRHARRSGWLDAVGRSSCRGSITRVLRSSADRLRSYADEATERRIADASASGVSSVRLMTHHPCGQLLDRRCQRADTPRTPNDRRVVGSTLRSSGGHRYSVVLQLSVFDCSSVVPVEPVPATYAGPAGHSNRQVTRRRLREMT
jgi:hypothetical protein